jgi:DNA-binding XRE family transcriptional regulator
MNSPREFYYTRSELTTQAGISHQTFYDWQREGVLPFIKVFKEGKRFKVYKSIYSPKELHKKFKRIKELNSRKRGRRVKLLES